MATAVDVIDDEDLSYDTDSSAILLEVEPSTPKIEKLTVRDTFDVVKPDVAAMLGWTNTSRC